MVRRFCFKREFEFFNSVGTLMSMGNFEVDLMHFTLLNWPLAYYGLRVQMWFECKNVPPRFMHLNA